VAVTGYGQEEDRRRSARAGFDHHLVKPVDVEALRELLARFEAPAPSEDAALSPATRPAP
jgi:CheY-like chemotaxis protein